MVKILHLYYDLMNLYGDYGNVVVLCDNLKKNGIDYELSKYSIGDEFDFDDYDFIFCGSGTESKTELAIKDFVERKESFVKAINNNKFILFTGSSIALLGNNGVGVFSYSVIDEKKRICGDVICDCKYLEDIVGYVNSSISIRTDKKSYIGIKTCDYALRKYRDIGYRKNNLLTINITGPLLVKNPSALKDLVTNIGLSQNKDFVYKDTINENQKKSYEITLDQLKKRFQN